MLSESAIYLIYRQDLQVRCGNQICFENLGHMTLEACVQKWQSHKKKWRRKRPV